MITLKISSFERGSKNNNFSFTNSENHNEPKKILDKVGIGFLSEMNSKRSEIIARSVTDFLFISDGCLSFKTNFVTQKNYRKNKDDDDPDLSF